MNSEIQLNCSLVVICYDVKSGGFGGVRFDHYLWCKAKFNEVVIKEGERRTSSNNTSW